MKEINNKAKKCLLVIIGIILLVVPLPTLASDQDSSVLTINILNEITVIVFKINGVNIGGTATVNADKDFTLEIQGASTPEFGETISSPVFSNINGGVKI